MEKFGKLGKQLNPPNMNKNGFKYDSGLTFYPGTIRIVSLQRASEGKKFALAANSNNEVIAQEITTSSSTNDKWRMVVWKNDSSNVFLYNIQYGNYLARKDDKLTMIETKELPKINSRGEMVNVLPNISCVWNGLNGNRHIYLSDDPKAKTLSKDINTGYCVKGSGKDITINPGKTCSLNWEPGALKPNANNECEDGFSCRYVIDKDFCDQEGVFQPGGLAISIESSPGIGTPIVGDIYLTIQEDNSVTVGSIPADIQSEMICTGTYVTGKGKPTPPICWTAIVQEGPESMVYTVPSRTGWSVSQMLSWNPERDGVLEYGRSLEPLAERFINKKLQILPEKEYLPFFGYSTSSPDATGCPTQYMSGTLLGPGRFPYMWNWQYTDMYTLFAGDQGTGADIELYKIDAKDMGIGMCDLDADIPGPCPSGKNCPGGVSSVGAILEGTSGAGWAGSDRFRTKYMIDAAHKNGVKIYGCGLFFQEIYYGGQYSWFMQALANPKLLAKKMVDVAVAYGFDGWMTNFETGVTDAGYTWGGSQKEGSAGYSGQIYSGKNYFTGEKISSDYWKNQIAGSNMPAFRMHGGDLCEGCTTCGSGPVGCGAPGGQGAPQSASSCLFVSDEDKKIGDYSTACSNVYVKGGDWDTLEKNCNNMSEKHKCKWVNVLEYKNKDGKSLAYDNGDGQVCRNPSDAAFAMTCENPSSKNQIGSMKFSGGNTGEATPWAAENIINPGKNEQATNAIVLRQKFREFLQEFKKYKNKLGVDISILMYDTAQLAGPIAGGITLPPAGRDCSPKGHGTCYGNFDLWVDDDGTPLVDQVYDMNSGQFEDITQDAGIVPQFRALRQKRSLTRPIVENYTDGNYLPSKSGWPKNTGPKQSGYLNVGDPKNLNERTSDCDGGQTDWGPFTNPNAGYCIPKSYEGSFINNGKRPRDLKLGLGRPYDYFQTIQFEGMSSPIQPVPMGSLAQSGDFSKALENSYQTFNSETSPPGPQTKSNWQQLVYCGIQGSNVGQGGVCNNDESAVEFPLTSVLKFDSGRDAIQSIGTILQGFANKAIGIDYIDRVTSVSWTGGHLLGREFRDNSSSSGNFKGFGHVITERYVKTKLPFSTYFSLGTGENYYNQGVLIPFGPWSNWSLQDQVPTWQWRPEACDPIMAQYLRISYDISDAYQKGNSLLFRYTPNPSDWLRTVIKEGSGKTDACDITTSSRIDCLPNYSGNDVKGDCAKKQCCYKEDNNAPWCYNKSSVASSTPSVGATISSTYMLYAIDIPPGEYYVSLITKTNGIGFIDLGISEKDDELTPIWLMNNSSAKPNTWYKHVKKIQTRKTSVCIWIKATVGTRPGQQLRLGGIEISQTVRNRVEINPHKEVFTNETGETSARLSWDNIQGMEYYEIYNENDLLGIAYQGTNPRDNTNMVYNLFNLDTVKPRLVGVPSGVKTSTIIKPVSPGMIVICSVLIIASAFLLFSTRGKSIFIKILFAGIGIISAILLAVHLGTRFQNFQNPQHAIAHWKDNKSHALNACFDDARVKCWRWLLYEWHKNKWPLKFSFYYNTLWLTRDLDWLRAVVKLGHEIGGHGHQHLTASDGSITEKYISDNIIFCAKLLREQVYQNPKEQLSYAYPHGSLPILASKRQSVKSSGNPDENGICGDSFCHTNYNCTTTCVATDCANIDASDRKDCLPNYQGKDLKSDCANKGCCYGESNNAPWCYEKTSKCQPGDGKSCQNESDCNQPQNGYKDCAEECQAAGAPTGCKTCGGQGGCGGIGNAQDPTANYLIVPFVKGLQDNYISARIVTDENNGQFLGITSWPPNQNTVNTRDKLPKGTDISQSIFKNDVMRVGLDPVWTLPYQIDLNHDSDPKNDAASVTKYYITQYETAMNIPNSMIILAGHDFNPTNPETGEDMPCDMAPNTTPMSLQKLTCACCVNPSCSSILDPKWNGSIPLYDDNGKFPELDWNKRPSGDPKVEGGVPTGACDLQWDDDKAKTCRQACDACWVPTPGSTLISLFNRIQQDADKIWFTTQKELIAYCYNRQNSKLTIETQGNNSVTYNLITSYSYDGLLSLLFPGAKQVYVNNKLWKILQTTVGKEYINVQPINGTIKIEVKY